jgi:tripartite-type tricarboxylate transporter receptor subunit TctC
MKAVLAALAVFAGVAAASAETYPTRPVRLVVPFPPGSAPDLMARIIGEQLRETLGQPVVIDNKSGALGTIAAAEVARSAPDGYTILYTTNTTQAAAVALFKKLPYDPVKDFAPVIRLITTSMILLVRADFPAETLKDFLLHARAKSGELTGGYGSAGSQVSSARLQSLGRFEAVDVPYRGVPLAVNDVISGELSFTFADFAVGLAQIKGGKLKGLGVTSVQRTTLAPDLPSLAEELPGFEVTLWYGLVAPAGTPPGIVNTLYQATLKDITKPAVAERFAGMGLDIDPMDPERFSAYIKTEIEKWSAAAKEAGIEPQ